MKRTLDIYLSDNGYAADGRKLEQGTIHASGGTHFGDLMPKKSLRITYIFLIIAVLISCSSCDSIKDVMGSDYSDYEGFYFTALRHGWQYDDGHAWYRVRLPDESGLAIWCTFDSEKMLIDSVRVTSNQSSSTIVGSGLDMEDDVMNKIENGLRFMEKYKLHFLLCKSKERVKCRMWVLGFWWVDLCKYKSDYQINHRVTEYKMGDGWILKISPPADWERYYLRELRQDNPD